MLTWARQRQIYYLFGVVVFLALVGLVLFLIYKPTPSCFDQKQNQDETGIDCGGVCTLACKTEARSLKVYWVRPLLVSAGWYDLVAQVENLNSDLGVRAMPYTFYLYGADNSLLTKREGVTFVNPGEKFVIFESQVATGEQVATKAFIEFSKTANWEKVPSTTKDLYLEKKEFTSTPKPSLNYLATNNGLKTLRDIQVIVVLSDIDKNTFAASATTIDKLEPNSQQNLYFTWPVSFSSEPSYIDPYWRINAFSLGN